MNSWYRQLIRFLTWTTLFLVSLSGQSQQKRPLKLWEHEKKEDQLKLDELIEEFETKFPGLPIKRSHYGTEDLRVQFQIAALGDGGADILFASNDFGGPLSIMTVIQPVDKIFDLSKFSKSTIDAVTGPQGRVWGIPYSGGNHLMLFVNKDHFKSLPRSIADIGSFTKQSGVKYPLVYNMAEPFWFVTFLGSYGVSPYKNGRVHLGGPAMVGALEYVRDLKFKHKLIPSDCDYSCAETLFLEGKASSVINGDWAVKKYKDTFKEKLAILPLPINEITKKPMSPMVSGKHFFLNTRTKGEYLKRAVAFIEFMTSREVQLRMLNDFRLPAISGIEDTKQVSENADLRQILKALENGQGMPMDVEMRAVWDAMRPQLQGVMAGSIEPKDAARVMQADAVKKIAEMKE